MTRTPGLPATTTYAYDPLSQLTAVDYPGGEGFPDTAYTYDAVGNRLQTVDGVSTHFVYDGASPVLSDQAFHARVAQIQAMLVPFPKTS